MAHYDITPALDDVMLLGESPVWDAENSALYWIDIPGKSLHRLLTKSGTHDVWQMPTEPGCICLASDRRLLVALRSGIAFFDVERGVLTELVAAPYDQTRMRFNDGRCDAAGRLIVGTLYEPRDHALAVVYSLDHGVLRDIGPRATVSNGVAFSPDGRVMYHADTTAHRITKYDYDLTHGTVANPKLLHQFSLDRLSGYMGRPDGAVVDSEGAYWSAMFEGGCLRRFSADGLLLEVVHLPVRCPTMLTFGAADLRTIYITTARNNRPAEELERYPLSGCVLRFQAEVAGLPEAVYAV